MLHHLTLWVPDRARAEESWSWLLGCLGYEREEAVSPVALFRHPGGFSVALEESPDMVPGMLYSRFRPGVNHLAFRVDGHIALADVVAHAPEHGWSPMANDWNEKVIGEFRANGCKVGGTFEGVPLVILHTAGAEYEAKTDREIPVVILEPAA